MNILRDLEKKGRKKISVSSSNHYNFPERSSNYGKETRLNWCAIKENGKENVRTRYIPSTEEVNTLKATGIFETQEPQGDYFNTSKFKLFEEAIIVIAAVITTITLFE
jgi:hypothetical protein